MRFLKLVFLLALATIACRGQDPTRLDQVVQSYVARGEFMGCVLVAKGPELLLSKGYGFANVEWNIPNAPSTKFRLGSLTKQFTAAAILILEEQGKLKVDDLVKRYLPDAPPAWDKVTIFHLLTHTSGIPSYTDPPEGASPRVFLTPTLLVKKFRDQPLEFEPGSKFKYSNSGYALLGYLIEKMSGDRYAAFIRKNIFDPLEMKDSGYDLAEEIIARRASGYARTLEGFRNAKFLDMSVPFSAGALYSTTEDLWRWEQGLFSGKLLSAAAVAKMTTPFLNNYAFGVAVTKKNNQKQISHSGAISGFYGHLRYYPDEAWIVIVLSNVMGPTPETIAKDLSAVLRGEKVVLPEERKEISVPRKILEQYVGTYGMEPGQSYTISLEGDRLMTTPQGETSLPLFPETENRFFLKAVDVQIEFVKDVIGHVTHLIVFDHGRERKIPRKD